MGQEWKDEIRNFIEYWTSDDKLRARMLNCLEDYADEVHEKSE